jgi:hypothetical protein
MRIFYLPKHNWVNPGASWRMASRKRHAICTVESGDPIAVSITDSPSNLIDRHMPTVSSTVSYCEPNGTVRS